MDIPIIAEILLMKRLALRELLELTESPIEKLFFAHVLRFFEKSLFSDEETNNRPGINGFRYITESNPLETNKIGKIKGLSVDYSTTGIIIDLPNLKYKDGFGNVKTVEITQKDQNPLSRNASLMKSPDGSSFTLMQNLQIIPQYEVKIGHDTYRLDFAFLLYENVNHDRTLVKKIAVECDGYEYHSNKDQFRKDRERQRKLSYDNWTIIQFSGSEINGHMGYDKAHFEKEMLKILQIMGFTTII